MSENIAISVYKSHVYRMYQYYLTYKNRTPQNMILFGIGRTTNWNNEAEPPIPRLDTTHLDETIGYKTLTNIYPVLPALSDGTISIDNMRWNKVNPLDSLDGLEARQIYGIDATDDQILFCSIRRQNCRWLYVSAEINSTDFPTSGASSFRQYGLFSSVVLKDTAPTSNAYLPEHIKDLGILEAYKNISGVYITSGVKVLLRLILEF
jgi:hypothetical protein